MKQNFPSFDRDQFGAWLQKSSQLTKRSTSDVCSRLNRLSTMIDLNCIRSPKDLQVALIRSDEFEKHGSMIRSQLKRAGMLYLQFLNSPEEKS